MQLVIFNRSYFGTLVSFRSSRHVTIFGLKPSQLAYHIGFYKKKKIKFLITAKYRTAMKWYYAYPAEEDFTYTYTYTYKY